MIAAITGQGPKLVMIHGWASSAETMQGLAAEFDDAFEVHCLDLPGHGRAATGRVDVGLDEMIESARDYVESLGEPVILVGWAMGALVALAVAAQLKVKALVCMGTPSGGAEFGPAFEKMAQRLVRDWPRYVRSSVDVIVGDRVSVEVHAWMCRIMQGTHPSVARRSLLDVARSQPRSYAAKVSAPVLVLHGAEDKISPVSIAEDLRTSLQVPHVKVYEKIGHAPFLEIREQTVTDIRTFLAEVSQ